MDTIFALATAPGKAGVAVIRVSGPEAHAAGLALAGTLPAPRRSGLRILRDAAGEALDEALVLMFAPGASFTGEPVVEFHLHGSLAVVQAVLSRLASLDGCRHATPGEFTRRALENGRLDLTQVEALADLIDSETEAQRKQALRTFDGVLGRRVQVWRDKLIRASSLIEVVMDFADEDIPDSVSDEVLSLLSGVRDDLARQRAGYGAAERVRSGFEVAIVGPPNAGKSTLLNALAGRDAAITSDIAGTTRDVIEVRMDLAGLPVTILDTAGLRETSDPIESVGVSMTERRARGADLRVFLGETDHTDLLIDGDIEVSSKADLTGDPNGISGATGQGLDRLIAQISERLQQRTAQSGLIVRQRQMSAVENGIAALTRAIAMVSGGEEQYDLAAEDLRVVLRALDTLIGRVDVEMLLDEIFSSFCLGK